MQDSPVLKLQDLSTSISIDLEELLLKGKMIAVKLGLKDASEWFERELNGYPDHYLPDYRILKHISPKAFNKAVNSWIPIHITTFFETDSPEYDEFTTVVFRNSVSMLQQFAKKEENLLYFDLPEPMTRELHHRSNQSFRMSWAISPATFSMMLTNIRSSILDWALSLEKNNIFGEGLLFTPEEKRDAQNVTYNNTINNHGNGMTVLGDVNSDSSVVGGTVSHVQQQNLKGDFSRLERYLKEQDISEFDIQELKQMVEQTPAPASKDEVGKTFASWIGKMTIKALEGALKVTGAAAPALLTNAICHHYGIPV